MSSHSDLLIKLKVYKVKDKDGQWASKGMSFTTKGKVWNGKGPLKLAFNTVLNRFKYIQPAFYSPRGNEPAIIRRKEEMLELFFNHAEENGWHVYEMTDSGARWLTVREFYSE